MFQIFNAGFNLFKSSRFLALFLVSCSGRRDNVWDLQPGPPYHPHACQAVREDVLLPWHSLSYTTAEEDTTRPGQQPPRFVVGRTRNQTLLTIETFTKVYPLSRDCREIWGYEKLK